MAFKIIDVELETCAKQAGATLHWLGQPHSSLVDPVDRKRSK
jgi:hypothetical protein